MKVLVTGSREFTDRALVWQVLDGLLAQHGGLIVVHGACPSGADRYADDWARARLGEGGNVLVDRYPANWGCYGRAAGFRRNAEMVAARPDLCVAFFQPGASNKGTSHCAKLAARAGIEVRRYGAVEPATEAAQLPW